MSLEKGGCAEFETDLERVNKTLSVGKEKKIDLIEFMQDCTALFEKIEICLRQGSARDKELVYRKLQELAAGLEKDIDDLCKQCGKGEEDISAYVENPDNFSQDTWLAIQKANRRILSGKQRKARRKPQ